MPKDDTQRGTKFNMPLARPNPALQPSTETSTESATLPATEPSTSPSTYTSTQPRRHHGELAYEKTHMRITHWLDNGLVRKLNALAKREGTSKSTLFDEAIRDLLEKYNAW